MTKPAKNLSPLNHFTVVTGELIIIWKFNPLMLGCNKIWYTLKWTCSFQLLVCLSVCNFLLPPCMKRLNSISVPIRIHCKKHFFFYQGFLSQTLTIHMTARGERGTIFYSTLPLPRAHEHRDIYLQLCVWDDYHVFVIATLVLTRLLLDEIYHLIELPFDWLIDWLIMGYLFIYLMNWF